MKFTGRKITFKHTWYKSCTSLWHVYVLLILREKIVFPHKLIQTYLLTKFFLGFFPLFISNDFFNECLRNLIDFNKYQFYLENVKFIYFRRKISVDIQGLQWSCNWISYTILNMISLPFALLFIAKYYGMKLANES